MKLINSLLVICFFVLLFSLSLTKSSDFNQDLGRHLKLGEIIVKTAAVPKTNLFSYTNPRFPFINHHWLSEVIFYLSASFLGLNSLIFLKVLLIMISFAVVIRFSIKINGLLKTMLTALILLPLILDRVNIRPEIFGYLLFSFLLTIVLAYPKNKKLLFTILLIMLLWVNFHISFIFGLGLLGLLILKIIFSHKRNVFKTSDLVLVLSGALVLLFNPDGLKGLLYPLSIFSNYGYTIVENQNLFYLNQVTANPLIKYFFLLSPLMIISLIILLVKSQLLEFILLIVFYLLSFFQIRHLPFFVLAAIPTVARSLSLIKIKKKSDIRFIFITTLIIVEITASLFFINNIYAQVFDREELFGLGFNEAGKEGAEFVKKNKLAKNIFNNFDIGGYLVYKLYPDYQLFIDNRPEAYPKDFIQNTYIKLQLDKNLIPKIFDRYQIKTVLFSHNDQTDWGKSFMKIIYDDPQWQLVYLDNSSVIFTKNSSLTDLRKKEGYFENLIKSETNYLNLLKLAQFFNLIDRQNLVEIALAKAKNINPNSCSLKKIAARQYLNSPFFYLGEEIKNTSWYCF